VTGHSNGQPSSRALAAAVVVANLVVCAGVVAVLGATRDGTTPAAFTPATTTEEPLQRDGPAQQDQPVPRDDPTVAPEPGPGDGFTEVTGPGGMTTHIPAGWPTRRATGEGSTQADDPAGTTTMLRYGGAATSATDTYDLHADYERTFASGKQAYVSIRLARTLVRGMPAIDWEFEYDAQEGRRHVRSVYWLSGGHEYFVYASSPVPIWAQTRKILDVMLTYSTP
jgi:hypothetical protein